LEKEWATVLRGIVVFGSSLAKHANKVGYQGDRAKKCGALWSFPDLAPLNSLGWDIFFGIPYPCPSLGPGTPNTPDGSPLTIDINK